MFVRSGNRRLIVSLAGVLALPAAAPAQVVHYVDSSATGAGDGTSWADAFVDLQDALAEASTNGAIAELRVAGGTYRPDCMPDPCVGTNGDREATFQLLNGVTIKGGYRGLAGGGDPDDRDIDLFESVLNGDLNSDDGTGPLTKKDNSYHVVCGDDLGFDTVLDGFTITGGNADDEDENDGGGITLDSSNLMVTDCVFHRNRASSGGAMAVRSGRPRVIDCLFLENAASAGGAVLDVHYGSDFAIFSRCVFEGNEATYMGGAIFLLSTEPDPGCATRFTDCTFVGNAAATMGGAVSDWLGGGLVYVNCLFSGNVAGDRGGAHYMTNGYQRSVFTNCTFSGNQAATGGGLYVLQRWPRFTNCVLWGNTDDTGAGESAQIHVPDGFARLNYSCVQGWTGGLFGEHTIDQDPLFANPAGQDGIVGTADDDLRLLPDSPCIDAGDNEVDTDLSTYEQDYLPNVDCDGSPRFADDPATPDTGQGTPPIVDMGAYEYQAAVVALLDIKPGSCPNPFNRNSHGVLPVVLVGTEDFDVMEIDVSTVRLSRADGVGGEVAPNEGPPGPHSVFADVATPFDGELCDCHELEGDGIDDLSMKFRTDDVVEVLELDDLDSGALLELVVTGSLLDGTPFQASDCIRLVPPGTSPGLLTVESNVAGAWIDASPLDDTLGGGGFAGFDRSFPQSTVVTLTAETPIHGRSFGVWEIDGVVQTVGQTVIEVTIVEGLTARTVYRPRPLKDPGLGEHDGWPVPLHR